MRIQQIRTVIAAALALTMTGFGLLSAEASAPAKAPTAKVVQKLLWSQEFNQAKGKNIDYKFWGYDLGTGEGGWGNREKQSYVANAVKTDGAGRLVITAKHHCTLEPQDGFPLCLDLEAAMNLGDALTHREFCADTDTQCQWTSGRIKTQGKVGFKYGRMEARIQMPAGDGTWPAFWMLGANLPTAGWPASGEIDIVEGSGGDPFIVSAALHSSDYAGGDALVKKVLSPKNLSAGFHNYAINWAPNKIQFLFDGKVIYTVTANSVKPKAYPFNQEFFLILNLAIGGTFVGNTFDPTLKSAALKIDWIRYYSVNGVGKVIRR